jgi:hypothetical protein
MAAGEPRALWPLPLLAGLLPLVATLLAWRLSIAHGIVPDCNPFLDGCTSISRSARHGLANILFRALLLPAAVLQALVWLLCPAWLRSLADGPERALRWLPALGALAGVFLVLYGSFLGTEGEAYRWMRRYGIVLYFGFTCIGMLVVADQMHRRLHGEVFNRRISRALLALCAALPLLGLVHVLLPLAWGRGEAAKDAIENITEWWGGAIFTAFFLVLAWAWRGTAFGMRLRLR